MEEEKKAADIKNYQERYKRWQDKTNQQVSFFNNLILTLSVGFLSFSYKEIKISDLSFEIVAYDLKLTLFVFSLIIILVSIFCGLIAAISRLYDFRVTTHINQVRYWVLKHSDQYLDESSLKDYKEKTPSLFCLMITGLERIDIDDCKSLKSNTKSNFKRLRALAHKLGITTWKKLLWQIWLFFIGIALFVISLF